MSNRHYSQLIEEKYSCPVCNSKEIQLDTDRAEIYCSKCGLVISSTSGGVLPYDYYEVQKAYPTQEKQITDFRHGSTNAQLMRYGLNTKKGQRS